MKQKKPTCTILYNGRDITRNVSSDLTALSYDDKVTGESDEISLTFDDSRRLWQNAWYPQKGDQLEATIGYEDLQLYCGVFDIDEIEISGAPAQIVVRGIAASAGKALRTRKSYTHENKTLRQIAQTVASANGLALIGEVADIRLARTTQNRESDLSFLKRIGKEYGYIFSVRGGQLIFSSIYGLDGASSVARIDVSQVSSYSFKDKLLGTFKSAEATYHNVESRETVKATETRAETVDGQAVTDATAEDVLAIKTKAENQQQAEAKAAALLYQANTKGQTGRITLEGNPLLVAGNNIELTGFGALSGKYQIMSSGHDIGNGYTTSVEVRRIGYVSEADKEPAFIIETATSINTNL